MSAELDRLRSIIDGLDDELIRVLAERFRCVAAIGREKAQLGRAVEDPERETSLGAKHASSARRHGLSPELASALFALLLRESKRTQRAAGGALGKASSLESPPGKGSSIDE